MRLLLLVPLFLLATCSDVKEALNEFLSFNIQRDIEEQSIEGSLATCPVARNLDINFFNIDKIVISKENDFPEKNTEVSLITQAILESFVLRILENSPEKTFDWIDKIEISVTSKSISSQLVPPLDPVPTNTSTLRFPTEQVDISSYLKSEDGFSFTTKVEGCPPSSMVHS